MCLFSLDNWRRGRRGRERRGEGREERILHKAEAAWRLLDAVKAHDDPLDVPGHGEQLVGLLLRGVEREVPHVERRRRLQLVLVLLARELEGVRIY